MTPEQAAASEEAWSRSLATLQAWEIASQTDLAQVSEFAKAGRQQRRTLEAKRAELIAPIREAERRIRELFAPIIEKLEAVEALARDKIAAFQLRGAQAQRQAMVLAAAQIAQGQAATVLVPQRAEVKGVAVREMWVPTVTDAGAVPREFCSPDLSKIKAAAPDAETAPPSIPGVTWERQGRVTLR